MHLTIDEARGLPAEELAHELDRDAADWQNRIDEGRMTTDDWTAHGVFAATRELVDLGVLFPIAEHTDGSPDRSAGHG
ncbi:hypothetical protein ACIRG5_47125 [Lentzea sp. NPDC102401]|uniref:hypothetical protein n=1 Tax=Lentzea sp. NPDC102401 TaxID=3364128 RepID=UPI00380959FC